jgi:transposase
MQRMGKTSQRITKRSKKYNTLPTKLTEKEFDQFFRPHLSLPRRGKKPKIPLLRIVNYILYQLHTGCHWKEIAIRTDPITGRKEISYTSVWKWFNRWAGDGSLDRAFLASVRLLKQKKKLRTRKINLDGTNSVAKKGAKPLGIPAISTKKDKRHSVSWMSEGTSSHRLSAMR